MRLKYRSLQSIKFHSIKYKLSDHPSLLLLSRIILPQRRLLNQVRRYPHKNSLNMLNLFLNLKRNSLLLISLTQSSKSLITKTRLQIICNSKRTLRLSKKMKKSRVQMQINLQQINFGTLELHPTKVIRQANPAWIFHNLIFGLSLLQVHRILRIFNSMLFQTRDSLIF